MPLISYEHYHIGNNASWILLLERITKDYLKEHPAVKTKPTSMNIIDGGKIHSLTMPVVTIKGWQGLAAYASSCGIDLFVRKQVIDHDKTWWPIEVFINAPQDNPYLVLIKLMFPLLI